MRHTFIRIPDRACDCLAEELERRRTKRLLEEFEKERQKHRMLLEDKKPHRIPITFIYDMQGVCLPSPSKNHHQWRMLLSKMICILHEHSYARENTRRLTYRARICATTTGHKHSHSRVNDVSQSNLPQLLEAPSREIQVP